MQNTKVNPVDQKASFSNSIIKAAYTLSLVERRLILLTLGGMQQSKSIDSQVFYSANIHDYASLCGVTTKHAYKVIKDAADTLFDRYITVTEAGVVTKFRWVAEVRYVEGASRIEICWSNKIIPYISELRTKYTSISVSKALLLTSSYSGRLFDLSQLHKIGNIKTKVVFFTLDELYSMLDISVKAREYKVFKRSILLLAIKELSEKEIVCIELIDTGSYCTKVDRKFAGVSLKFTW
jgi:plasmid replication initiation protein